MTGDEIGTRLRAVRLQQGISVRGLAQSLGVSPSLISQVETGRTQPSVSTLFAIVTELDVSLDALLADAPQTPQRPQAPQPAQESRPVRSTLKGPGGDVAIPPIQRGADNPAIEMENGVRWERLAMDPHGSVDMILVTYEPGATSSVEDRLMRHAGHEFAYVLEGQLTLRLNFDTHVLSAGDSLQFDSTRPHLFFNHTDAVARGVWFVVGHRDAGLPTAPGPSRRDTDAVSSAVDVLHAFDR